MGNEVGDKVVFGGSLKSVVGQVVDEPITTEEGEDEVDAIIAFTSAQSRMVPSVTSVGMINRIIEHIDNEALKMFFDE